MINTIIPIKFAYAKQHGTPIEEQLLDLIRAIKPERNSIVDKFNQLQHSTNSAMDSQALIQLKNHYCDTQKCLQCAIGNMLLNK